MTVTTSPLSDPPLNTFVWLRRMVLASVATLLALAIAWPITQRLARHRLDSALSRLRKAGVAMKITDLRPAPLADQDNAAWYYQKAFAAISTKFDAPRSSNYDYPQLGVSPDFTAFWQTLVDRSEVENAAAFKWARQARAHRAADWGIIFKSPAMSILLPHLNECRNLANVVADGAERSFFVGDSAEGIERIRDVLHLARSLSPGTFLVTALVADGIDALAVDALMPHIGTLRVGEGKGMVSRRAIRELQLELLRQDTPMDRLVTAMCGEATGMIDHGEIALCHAHIGRPAMTADLARVCGRYVELLAAATAPSNVERNRRLAAVPLPAAYPSGFTWQLTGRPLPSSSGQIAVGRPLTHSIGAGSFGRAYWTSASVASVRDAAAIALGLRLYELDHAGAWPATLDELVPQYLPAIPVNHSSADDAPYAYQLIPAGLPDGRDRPILVKSGQRITRGNIPVSSDTSSGPTVELSSLARREALPDMPTTTPAIPPTTRP